MVWRKSIHFSQRYARKNDFYIFVPNPSDLDLSPLDLEFVLLVTLVQRYGSTKLEVFMAFLFGENRRHETDRQTDGMQHLMRPPGRVQELLAGR